MAPSLPPPPVPPRDPNRPSFLAPSSPTSSTKSSSQSTFEGGGSGSTMGQVPSASGAALQSLAILQSQLQVAATRPRSSSLTAEASGSGKFQDGLRRERSSSLKDFTNLTGEAVGRAGSEMSVASLKGKEKARPMSMTGEIPSPNRRTVGGGSAAGLAQVWHDPNSLAFPPPPPPSRAFSAPPASTSFLQSSPLPPLPNFPPRAHSVLPSLPSIPSSPSYADPLPDSPLYSPLSPSPIDSPTLFLTPPLPQPSPPLPPIPSSRTWHADPLYSRPDLSTSEPNLGLGLTIDASEEAFNAGDGFVRRTSDQGPPYIANTVAGMDRSVLGEKAEKRYHALKELVQTEAAYLENLTILVKVHFQTLPFLGVLSSDELSTVVRSANDVLELHERIGKKIESVNSGFQWESTPEREEVVRMAAGKIASIFLDELPNFILYHDFCARHGEALDLVRLCESQPQWDAYERQCSSRIAERRLLASSSSPAHQTASTGRNTSDRGDTTPLAVPSDPFFSIPSLPPPPSSTHSLHQKLRFHDYFIQPIQRICRYPLIIGQVLKQLGECSERSVVKRAWDGVRRVAEGVDEAKRVRESELRTRIVASRMEFPSPVNLAFCDLLGGTLLMGTLHTLHRSSDPDPPRVRYLGCFLYNTHLVMVKVKKRESYEPREWLPLRLFEITDVPESEELLPHSIRLSYQNHHFELGATCAPEKAVWLSKLCTVQSESRRQWDSQPLDASGQPTLFDDTLISSVSPSRPTPPPATTVNRTHTRSGSAPPRINISITPIVPSSPLPSQEPTSPSGSTTVPLPSVPLTTLISRPNRFSATTSSLLGRTPASQRAAIDLRLADVFSEECLAARAQAARQQGLRGKGSSSSVVTATPRSTRTRTLSNGAAKATSSNGSLGKLSMKEKRRMSAIDVGSSRETSPIEFRGAIGHDANSSQVYKEELSEKKWLAALSKAKLTGKSATMTSLTRKPLLVDLDMSMLNVEEATSQQAPSPSSWISRTMSVRRAASHSSLEKSSPTSPTFSARPILSPKVAVDVERNNSVSSNTTTSSASTEVDSSSSLQHGEVDIETPPSSPDAELDLQLLHAKLPIAAKWSSQGSLKRRPSQLAFMPRERNEESHSRSKQPSLSVITSPSVIGDTIQPTKTKGLTRSSTFSGFFSKKVHSSPMLSNYFGVTSSTPPSASSSLILTPPDSSPILLRHPKSPISPDASLPSTASSSPSGSSLFPLPSPPDRAFVASSTLSPAKKSSRTARFNFYQQHQLSPLS